MVAGIIGGLLPLIFKLIEHFLDKKKAERETIEAFYKFIEKLDKDSQNSVKLSKDYIKALEELEELKNKEKEQESQ